MFLVMDNRGKGRDVTIIELLSMHREQLYVAESQYLRVSKYIE